MSFVTRLLDRRGGTPGSIDPVGRVERLGRAVCVIEPMRRRHLRAVLSIEGQVYPRPWTLAVFHAELDRVRTGERYYVVAKLDGEIVGYGGLLLMAGEAHVTNLAVDPAWHRRGVGRSLLAALAREAISRDCAAMSLEVRVSNRAAQELYQRFGFTPAGVRKKYYENVEDAIVMWCHDIDTPEYARQLLALEAT